MSFSLLPDLIFPALTDVTPQALMARGIELLLLDFDNTIVPYTTDVPTERMEKWLREMQKSGVRLCVVSNSKKPRVQVFCKAYGLDCITRAKKPFQRGIRAAKEKYGIAPEHMALVGDQIYTDVLGANCGGITSILVRAIHNHNFWLRLRHVAELPFIAIGKRRIQHEKP